MTRLNRYVWLNVILAPCWFLVAIVLFSIYYAGQGLKEAEISVAVSDHIPMMILGVQMMLFATLLLTSKKLNLDLFLPAWQNNGKAELKKKAIFGFLLGVGLFLTYIFLLVPLQTYLQLQLGDYVPAGETLKALSSQKFVFFIANVVCAPFVEENLYRNFVLFNFLQKYSKHKAVFLSSLFFGLLHWTGGFWYILMTMVFVGIPFAYIVSKQKNILLVFVAHLSLNLFEYLYVTAVVSSY